MSNKSWLDLEVQIAIKKLDQEKKLKSLKIYFVRYGGIQLTNITKTNTTKTNLTDQVCPSLYIKILDELKLIEKNYKNVIVHETCTVDYEVLSDHQIMERVEELVENEKSSKNNETLGRTWGKLLIKHFALVLSTVNM